MKWIGLTGGIATGKSTVKKLIEGLGCPVIDADFISHQLTEFNQPGYLKVVSHFGTLALNSDQTLNRKVLGEIIFNDIEKRNQLEQILHPLIRDEVFRQKEFYRQQGVNLCFYDVPLLFEKNLKNDFDLVILVWSDPVIQKARLAIRNQFSDDEIQIRLNSQTSMPLKIKNADFCLDNSTDLAGLERQVLHLLQTIG